MSLDFLEGNRRLLLSQIRPAWMEVNLDAIKYNAKSIKEYIGPACKLAGVIKGNAYSHGAVEAGQALVEAGVDYFGVATLGEALQLRTNDISSPILVLGYTPSEHFNRVVSFQISQTIFTLDQAKELSKVAQALNEDAIIHIKVDTGMGRLGFPPNKDSIEIIKEIMNLENIKVEGIFSHFSHSNAKEKDYTDMQFKVFMDFIGDLEKENISLPIKHISNAAAVIDQPEYNLDMVRVGISLFGIYPMGINNRERIDLKPTFEIKARISFIKDVPPGKDIGYDRTYTTDRPTKIATVPIGYADGYTEEIATLLGVLVKGEKRSLVGKVCMDQIMIDITGLDSLKIGDEVTIITYGDSEKLSTRLIANFSQRLPRVYLKENNILKIVDKLNQ